MAIGVLVGCSATERALDLEHIANIDDGNELTHHLLEVILGHLLRTQVGRCSKCTFLLKTRSKMDPVMLFSDPSFSVQMPPENLLHANEQGAGMLALPAILTPHHAQVTPLAVLHNHRFRATVPVQRAQLVAAAHG